MNPRFFASPPVFQHSAIMPGALILTALDIPVANELPRHDPPLVPRDDAVFLLTAAAEIEHALMVQYLFAAYSLRGTQQPAVDTLQQCLLQIAREEMGHLMTVQNLLHLLGGPLNFNREHAPYASDIYPFRFKLEPVTLDALAKYVMAESPRNWSGDEQQEIAVRANRSNDGVAVNHVGPIFASLQVLFRDELADEDFQLDTTGFQGNEEDWGQGRDGLIIRTFGGANVAAVRQAAYLALNEIVQQGEGEEDSANSHFQRFLLAYRAGRELFANGMPASTWPVAENPNTTPPPPQPLNQALMIEAMTEAHDCSGRLTNPRAKSWAHLFNLRYRMLLANLSHYLRLDQTQQTVTGDGAPRGLLLGWTFGEMGWLSAIAQQLVQLPKDEPPGALHAGPPFELPYSLQLPEREVERWRTHLVVSQAATMLVERMMQAGETGDLLPALLSSDRAAQVVLRGLITGQGSPPKPEPLPVPGAVSFAVAIQRLFRANPDRVSMLAWFDLHKFEDVRDHAERILERLTAGDMPCDGGWPADRIELFRRWIAEGKQP